MVALSPLCSVSRPGVPGTETPEHMAGARSRTDLECWTHRLEALVLPATAEPHPSRT